MRRLVDGRLGAVLLPVLGLAVLIAVWWLGVLAFHVQPFILPTPWQVAKVFIDSPGDLLGHLRASTVETLEGYALAVVVGLAIALAVVGATVAELSGATEGLMYAVQSYSGQGATAPAVAALVLLAALSIVLYYLLVAVERRLLPWARATSG